MQVRESLAMEPGTTFTSQRGYTISRTTMFLFVAFFICSVVAAGFLVYNFAACPALPISQATICDRQQSSGILGSTSLDNSIIKAFGKGGNEHSPTRSYITNRTREALEKDVRLPRSVIPIAYDIKLIPFLVEGNFTFNGEIKIHVKIKEECKNITLHAAEIQIQNHDVKIIILEPETDKGKVLEIKNQYAIETKQFHVIEFNEVLPEGAKYEISIKYVGYLLDFLQGFYRSSYMAGNETKWLAATQFQPTDARRAFPCFDEPALKAKFNLSIARLTTMSSISNMPKINRIPEPVEDLPDYVWDIYQESVPMSTYLVAFVVSDFANLTNGSFSVWARGDAINAAKYALEVGPPILKFLENFFGIQFPLPKIDMIALPDFHAGAMENWGLITYRETAMLYEDGVAASSVRQRVATVVAHELAHQWFGNLVTPSWWSDIWLNEGFASYMEYLGVDSVEPSWKTMDQFVVNELQNVFTLDALSSSHKISVEVGNPDEINEIFDRISYGKGATIIRMMSHFLTSNIFQKGLKNYLQQMSYQSAEQDDLWRFLTDEARAEQIFDNKTSVKEIMDTWTLQTGYPVVTIIRDNEKNLLRLKQERFVYVQLNNSNEPNPIWWIPITYTTSNELDFNNTRPTSWIRRTMTSTIDDPKAVNSDWFIFNIQQTGYYRVNYHESNWKKIISFLRDPETFNKIAPSNRAQLIDDALNLARGGYLHYDTALDVTMYLKNEDDYVPWKAAITALNFLDSMLLREGDYYLLKKYVLSLLENVYKKVGFDDSKDRSDMLTIYKRIDVLTAACHLGFPDCVHRCTQLFKNWMADPNPDARNPISPNLKTLVYCTAIKYGTEVEWDFAYERFLKTTVSSEKEILLSALGCSRDTWVLTRYLKRSLSDEFGIRKQDVFRVFAAVSNNVVGQPVAFNYIRNHWKELKDYLGSVMANLNSIVKYSTRRMSNKFELEELRKFVNTHYKDSVRSVQQAIERVEINIAWMERNYKSIIKWLSNVPIY